MDSGAGEGNRTLVMSLGSSGNAIIRRPLRALFLPESVWELKRVRQLKANRIDGQGGASSFSRRFAARQERRLRTFITR